MSLKSTELRTLQINLIPFDYCFQVQAVYNAMRRDDRMKYFL